jgi:hypothetical protein
MLREYQQEVLQGDMSQVDDPLPVPEEIVDAFLNLINTSEVPAPPARAAPIAAEVELPPQPAEAVHIVKHEPVHIKKECETGVPVVAKVRGDRKRARRKKKLREAARCCHTVLLLLRRPLARLVQHVRLNAKIQTCSPRQAQQGIAGKALMHMCGAMLMLQISQMKAMLAMLGAILLRFLGGHAFAGQIGSRASR